MGLRKRAFETVVATTYLAMTAATHVTMTVTTYLAMTAATHVTMTATTHLAMTLDYDCSNTHNNDT